MATLSEVVAKNLRTARLNLKLSQEALAARAGLSTSFVSMLERGQRSPPLDTLEQLAKALRKKPAELLGA